MPSCSFAEIFFGYSHRTEAAADQHLGPKKGGVFFDVRYQKLTYDVKVPWIKYIINKKKNWQNCSALFLCCNSSLFGISLDPHESVKV